MAEFTEVWKQWTRMCGAHEDCSECPMRELGCNLEFPCNQKKFSPDLIEHIVMEWAKAHPEPVYPTFAEWLNSIGVAISDRPFPAPDIPVYVFQVNAKMFEPIPADIAQKLEIEPKEG